MWERERERVEDLELDSLISGSEAFVSSSNRSLRDRMRASGVSY